MRVPDDAPRLAAWLNAHELQLDAAICSKSLREFIYSAWRHVESHAFVPGWSLDAIADHLQAVSEGHIRRLMINIPPRSTKSVSVSVLWPAWEWTWNPASQWLFAAYADDLAIRDAVKSRYLMNSAWYQARWGHRWSFPKGENLKSRYSNDCRGYRMTTSVGGGTTGEGGDRLVIDDPHNLYDVYSDAKRHAVLDWWDVAMRNRLNDAKTGARVLVGQRSHDNDLFGHILAREHGWTHLMLPMEFEPARRCTTVIGFSDPRKDEGELLNPARFGAAEVAEEKIGKTERDYQAQYQQRPTGQSGIIIKREWWRAWPDEAPPVCSFVLQFMDTAFEEKEEADYSARTTWGIFARRERWDAAARQWQVSDDPADEQLHCILLERWRARVGFPELREAAQAGNQQFEPDWLFIEKKASGHSLVQELRAAKVPVRAVKKTIDKVSAMHLAAIVPEKGRVWYMPRPWAQDVIDETTKFPMGEFDDLSDTCAMAWMWLRRRGEIQFADEEDDAADIDLFAPRRAIYG